jgi:hypothetical protein
MNRLKYDRLVDLFKLLLKPIKYRLLLGELTPHQSANSKVLASMIFYIGRQAASVHSHVLVRVNN